MSRKRRIQSKVREASGVTAGMIWGETMVGSWRPHKGQWWVGFMHTSPKFPKLNQSSVKCWQSTNTNGGGKTRGANKSSHVTLFLTLEWLWFFLALVFLCFQIVQCQSVKVTGLTAWLNYLKPNLVVSIHTYFKTVDLSSILKPTHPFTKLYTVVQFQSNHEILSIV